MRPRVTVSWQRCIMCRNIILLSANHTPPSLRVGDWDPAQVFIASMQLLYHGMSWPIIDGQAQLRSVIQSRIKILNLSTAHFDKLPLNIDVSVQLRQSAIATICLQSTHTAVRSALSSIVYFILIVFSSALNKWMLFTQIVISHINSQSGRDSLSRWTSTIISIYAWMVCNCRYSNTLNC
jgi:hypothetical protein